MSTQTPTTPKPKFEIPRRHTMKTIEVTPEIAREWLENSTNTNRRIAQPRVEHYRDMMLAGQWGFTGQNIIFSKDGSLLDGQHRLWAIIEAAIPITTGVTFGIAKEEFIHLDSGKPRGGGDALSALGYASTTRLAAGARILWEYQNGVFGFYHKKRISNLDIVKVVEENPNLVLSCRLADGWKSTGLTGGEVSGLHYIFGEKDTDMASEFFSALSTGANLASDSPILKLKTRLAQAKALKGYNLSKLVRAAFTIKAWNAYRRGQPIKQLRFTPSGSTKEVYPIPI